MSINAPAIDDKRLATLQAAAAASIFTLPMTTKRWSSCWRELE